MVANSHQWLIQPTVIDGIGVLQRQMINKDVAIRVDIAIMIEGLSNLCNQEMSQLLIVVRVHSGKPHKTTILGQSETDSSDIGPGYPPWVGLTQIPLGDNSAALKIQRAETGWIVPCLVSQMTLIWYEQDDSITTRSMTLPHQVWWLVESECAPPRTHDWDPGFPTQAFKDHPMLLISPSDSTIGFFIFLRMEMFVGKFERYPGNLWIWRRASVEVLFLVESFVIRCHCWARRCPHTGTGDPGKRGQGTTCQPNWHHWKQHGQTAARA